ncbi:MAG: glycosyltransferase family 39 protein, partial [Cyanobacteria bacterium]|nr:glycosyltransferase family 39 protein [Cyanobacteriota bacterium]
ILIYWLIGSAYSMFGVNAFAARFFSAVFATILTLTCYWAVRCASTRRAALVSGIILASSPLVVTFARMSLVDMVFSSCLGIALCSTLMTLSVKSKRWWPAIYIALGLAVLTKGPAALLLYGTGIAGYGVVLAWKKEPLLESLSRLHLVKGAILFALIAVPWYVAVGLATNGLWDKVFFMHENFGRFIGSTVRRNAGAWWYYMPVVAYGLGAWALLLPSLAHWTVGRLRSVNRLDSQSSATFMLALWFLSIFAFFSVSQTKLNTYLIPAFPAIAMLCGLHVDHLLSKDKLSRRDAIVNDSFAVLGSILLLVAVLLFCASNADASTLTPILGAKLSNKLMGLLSQIPPSERVSLVAGLACAGVPFIAQRWFVQSKKELSFAIIATGVIAATTIGAIASFSIGYHVKQRDLDIVAQAAVGKEGSFAIYQEFRPRLFATVKRPVDSFFAPNQIHRVDLANRSDNPPGKQYIFTRAPELRRLFPELELVKQSGDWCLLASDEVTVERLPTLEQALTRNIKFSSGKYTWGVLPLAGGTRQ